VITLVLLPGMDGTGDLFDPFIAALGGEFSVKVVRYPVTDPLGYAELEAFARGALPTDDPFVLLGESFSGPIAISLAASASQRLQGLILCCTFARNPRPGLAGFRSVIDFLPIAFAPVRILSHLLLGRFSTPALRTALLRSLGKVTPSALRARLAAVLSVDVSTQLSEVKVPILYLRAASDRLVPPSASELISQCAPATRMVELNAPHFLLQAAPAEAARVVRAFVHEVRAQAQKNYRPQRGP
jgi:pimeloyl-ACP methyl ester carboxylesterase